MNLPRIFRYAHLSWSLAIFAALNAHAQDEERVAKERPLSDDLSFEERWTTAGRVGGNVAAGTRVSFHETQIILAHRWLFANDRFGFTAGGYWLDDVFSSPDGLSLSSLRARAFQFEFEYYVEGQLGAALRFRPGLYYEGHADGSAWDLPVQLVTGYEFHPGLDLVYGVSIGRFYRLPVPIFGVAWRVNPRLRVDAILPEPAVLADLTPRTQLRVGGELCGGGFRGNAQHGNEAVEFSSYDVTVKLSEKFGKNLILDTFAGIEIDRRVLFRSSWRDLRGRSVPFICGLQLNYQGHALR